MIYGNRYCARLGEELEKKKVRDELNTLRTRLDRAVKLLGRCEGLLKPYEGDFGPEAMAKRSAAYRAILTDLRAFREGDGK